MQIKIEAVMKKDVTEKELYLGCFCGDLDHISHFIYYPDYEENTISCTVRAKNYFNKFYQIWIAIRYIFNPSYKREGGILNCFNFQEKDLSSLDIFLSSITSEVFTDVDDRSKHSLYNDKWIIEFNITTSEIKKLGEIDAPRVLGWDIYFIPRKFFARKRFAFKYIFNILSDQQDFEIDPIDARRIRGMIK